MLRLRDLCADDTPHAAQLVGALPLYQRYGYTAQAAERDLQRALVDGRSRLLAASYQGALVGCVWAIDRGAFGRSLYVRLVAVDGTRHGLGIGRAMMAHVEAWPEARRGVVLLCSADNQDAQRFYERLNYRRVGALPEYVGPGLDELIYYKAHQPPSPSPG
ncbi:MAG: GNAT family N-acetyltransferase [Deltaproteobacteria bacterium]|nr:MAG: GNAT family N-acetyltransferase [Deltaproteobacteria bacterium]